MIRLKARQAREQQRIEAEGELVTILAGRTIILAELKDDPYTGLAIVLHLDNDRILKVYNDGHGRDDSLSWVEVEH